MRLQRNIIYVILISISILLFNSISFGRIEYRDMNLTLIDTTSNGFIGDGVTENTKAIQAALDSVSAAGGGIIRFSNGKFLTGPLTIQSNDTLEIDSSAGILGTTRMTAYYQPGADTTKPTGSYQPLLTANHANNIAIIGKGYIDGQGQEWWTAYENGTISARPRMFQPNHCNNVLLRGITLKNSPQFHFIPEWCTNVTVDSVTILAPSNSPNTDGIDPATCHNVYITNCYIDTGDDCVAVKSGNNDISDPNAGCSRIYISHCTFMHGHGVSIGSETNGGVDSMYVDSCTFNSTDNGLRIKSYRGKGGNVRDIYYTNITMTNVQNAIYFTEYYPSIPPQSDPAQPINLGTPHFHDITVENLTVTGSPSAGVVIGVPEMPLTNIHFQNVNIQAQSGLQVRNATVDTTNVTITASNGRGSYLMQVNGYVTGATAVENNFTPAGYSLSQNYPNPFNPSTKINFSLAKASYVRLDVYNVLGQHVETLIDQNMKAGEHEYNFNASRLSSGVYLYKINAGNYIQTRKLILLK